MIQFQLRLFSTLAVVFGVASSLQDIAGPSQLCPAESPQDHIALVQRQASRALGAPVPFLLSHVNKLRPTAVGTLGSSSHDSLILDPGKLPSGFGQDTSGIRDPRCGTGWLSKHLNLDLRPRLDEGSRSIKLEGGSSNFSLLVENFGAGSCNPKDLEIWAAVYGPENLATIAEPATDGTCTWTVPFRFTAAGAYLLVMKVLTWKGQQEFNMEKCGISEGFLWEGGHLLASTGMDERLYVEQEGCCELCTRNARCTHFSAGVQGAVMYKGAEYKCLLFANATHKSPSDAHVMSGVSREEETATYLGSSMSFKEDAGMSLNCHSDMDQLTSSNAWLNVTRVFSALESQNHDEHASPKTKVVNLIDQDIIEGRQLVDRDPAELCNMDTSVTTVPHEGRWVDVTDAFPEGPSSDDEMKEFCHPEVIDGSRPPVSFIGRVRGTFPLELGGPRGYYWQPYHCRDHYFERKELRDCLLSKKRTNFLFLGDSLMTSMGTGLFATFYELVSGLNHSDGSEENEFKNMEEKSFRLLKQATLNPDASELRDVDIHAVITNFMMPNTMWHNNFTIVQELVRQEATNIETMLAEQHHVPAPLRYYMAPPAFVSEREAHITMRRGANIAKWLRQELIPRGWVELDLFSLSMARGYDSTCASDGVHAMHNVRLTLSQALANHLCRTQAPAAEART